MDNNTKYDDKNRNYISKRKKSGFLFITSVYAFCILFLLIRFGVIKYNDNNDTIIIFLGFIIFIINCSCLSHMDHSKRFYKKIPVPNYNDINVFTWKEIIFYFIPVIITGYFAILQIICLVLVLGAFYHKLEMMNKPYFPVERQK